MTYLLAAILLFWLLLPFFSRQWAAIYHLVALWLLPVGLLLMFVAGSYAWLSIIAWGMAVGSLFLQLFANTLVHYR